MRITAPGRYTLPMDAYHGQPCAGPSISSSGLKTIFLESPAHYWVESSLNPDRIEPDETEAFILGRAAHHLLLGEDNFSTLFVMRPAKAPDGRDWNGNNLTCKAWLAEQRDAGRTVLTPMQIETIRGMARALASHPLVKAGILNGKIEQSLIWQDEETGVWLKSRPDAIPTDGDFADLKTTVNYGFDLDRDVSKYRYDIQAALTARACRIVLGREMESFSLVFVGKKPPYCVEVLTLHKADVELAELDLQTAVRTFAWCVENKTWFGPSGVAQEPRYVRISEWAHNASAMRREWLEREITYFDEVK